jgi:REP element-mobilizing transposase RayT
MELNRAGEMVQRIWSEIPQFYEGFVLHDFVVMPNHFHGVIEIVGTIPLWLSDVHVQKQLTISDIVHRFKTLTTRKYIDGVYTDNWEGFHKQLWQRSYHEHVIRDEKSYMQIVDYVQNNPLKWVDDCYFGMK